MEINIYTILLFILSLGMILIGICTFNDWVIDKEFAEKDKLRDKTEKRLNESLKTLCTQLGIKLTYHQNLGKAAGRILYDKTRNGRLVVDTAEIEILDKYRDEPWTLAHELGHYLGILSSQDNSEETADREGEKLCRLILTKEEQELLSIPLSVYFSSNQNI